MENEKVMEVKRKDARYELRLESELKERAMQHAQKSGVSLAELIARLLKKTVNTKRVA